MATPRVTRARQLAAHLSGAGISCTVDVRELAGRLPAVLLRPPALAFDVSPGSTATWSLLAVAGTSDELLAWEQLDQLLDDVAALLPVESAAPGLYPLAGGDTLPAYTLTVTDTLES